MAGPGELAGRELIPGPPVQQPARPALADPAHPDRVGRSELLQLVPVPAATVDDADPSAIVTVCLRGERTPLHR